jgi:hypothetical protein
MNALAGEKGTGLKADQLRAEPYADAKNVGPLNRGDTVEILSKKGAWLQIKTAKNQGWVRILSVKRGDSKASTTNPNDLLNLASGRSGTGQVVATTGIRGLNEEELKAATFNEEETKKLENNTISAESAKKFADAGKLHVIPLKELEAPKTTKEAAQ